MNMGKRIVNFSTNPGAFKVELLLAKLSTWPEFTKHELPIVPLSHSRGHFVVLLFET